MTVSGEDRQLLDTHSSWGISSESKQRESNFFFLKKKKTEVNQKAPQTCRNQTQKNSSDPFLFASISDLQDI